MKKLMSTGRRNNGTNIEAVIEMFTAFENAGDATSMDVAKSLRADEKYAKLVPDGALTITYTSGGHMIHGPANFKYRLKNTINAALSDPKRAAATEAMLVKAGLRLEEVPAEVKSVEPTTTEEGK